jgi:molybdenum cofactor cytidylyltransferase
MDLLNALDLKRGEIVAFTGAGGKTSAIFNLARDLKSPVIVTTTTHMGAWQSELADHHLIINTPEDAASIHLEDQKILLLTGNKNSDDRLTGLNSDVLAAIKEHCLQMGIPLLIEADGAKQLPLKAPADHEPVIPAWVDRVVVLAGLSGLNQQLNEAVVHRPEIYSIIANLPVGELITANHAAAVLRSKDGGLKGIPDGVRRTLFLNQADTDISAAHGARLARSVIGHYDQVFVGALNSQNEKGPILSVSSRTACIILGAGGSERLGRAKQLLSWQGVPFIRKVVLNGLEAGLSPLIVVTGADHDQNEAVLADLPVNFINNPQWQSGQASSMQAGIAELPKNCDSVMFLLSDQPQVTPHLIRQLLERYAQNRQPITAPMINGQRGNPVLFSKQTFQALMEVVGDQGGRAVFKKFNIDWLDWVDERFTLDVDRPGDELRLYRAFFTA